MPTENKPADPKPTGLSQGWNLIRKNDGFVVGHQSVAYPPDEKAIERAERDGYVWVPFLVPAAQPQGEPVAEVYRGPVSGISRIRWIDYKTAPVGTKLYAEQPAPDNALKAFAREMINAAFEGGSFDGGDIQDIAVKHGLLRIERREEECGEVCACRSEGDGFPAECYRKTELLLGEQPAPVVVVFPERSNERDHAGDFTYEEKAWNACLDEVKRLNK